MREASTIARRASLVAPRKKRSDCKLLVLALCINKEGFIRYSSILEGNTADPKSLPDMIESLTQKSPARKEKTLIVMDAGIATEENLTKIKAKGYNYLCVSRTRLKEYTLERTTSVSSCRTPASEKSSFVRCTRLPMRTIS